MSGHQTAVPAIFILKRYILNLPQADISRKLVSGHPILSDLGPSENQASGHP